MSLPIAAAPQMRAREWGMLLLLSLLWGGSFYFFKVLVDEWPPLTVVLARVAVAAVALNLLLAARGEPMPPEPRLWGRFMVLGFVNNALPFFCIVWAETRIPTGLASILNATTPVFTVVVAHYVARSERLTAGRAAGILLGFVGVVILVGPAALAGGGGFDLAGEAASLLGALSYACAGVYGRTFRGVKPLHVATGQITAATLLMLPVAGLVDRPWTLPLPSMGAIAALLALSLVCTSFAYVLYFRILAVAGATNLLLVTFLVPVGALLLGVLVLGESLAPQALAGMAVIGLALAAIDGRACVRARSWL